MVLIKPDAVRRRLIGRIIERLEARGLTIRAMKMVRISRELAEKHYAEHASRAFYPKLVSFMTSGPIVAMAVSGPAAVTLVRKMIGATDPTESEPGSIRGEYSLDVTENLVHGSDSPESAASELALWFEQSDYVD